MCGAPFSRGNGAFVRPAMKILSEYSQNTLRILSEYSQNTLRWQFGGQGLNFNAPREDPTPLSGVRETQWIGVQGQRGRKRRNCNSVGSNPTEFQLLHLRPQRPCTPPPLRPSPPELPQEGRQGGNQSDRRTIEVMECPCLPPEPSRGPEI